MVTTNPMRMLAAAGIGFEAREYQYDESDLSGVHAAAELGLDPDCTFKTLVLRGGQKRPFRMLHTRRGRGGSEEGGGDIRQ